MKYQKYIHRTGMLSVDYPLDWTVIEYPEDPRAKVEFRRPSDSLIARLIVMPASVQTLDDLLPDYQERESQLRTLGIKPKLISTSIREVDARVIIWRHKGIEQKLILFVDAGLYCNFSFECSLETLKRNQVEFLHLVESACLSFSNTLAAETVISQLIASRIRRAELGRDSGNYTIAHEAIREGLELDPGNQRLLEIKSQIYQPQHGQDNKTVGEKHQAAKLTRLLVSYRLAIAILSFLGAIAVDSLQLSPWYAVPLIVSPFFDLRRQIILWVAHLRTFERPEFVAMRRMVRLDALRAYDAKQNELIDGTERNLFNDALPIVLLALLSLFIAWITNWYPLLYITSLCIMLCLKAIIRRSRPPAILLLGASGSAITLLHLALLDCAKPFEVVSLLRHSSTSWNIDRRLRFMNFRTNSNVDWQKVVTELVDICPIVVLDLRQSTEALQLEIEICKNLDLSDRLFVVRDTQTLVHFEARTFDFNSATRAVADYISKLGSKHCGQSR